MMLECGASFDKLRMRKTGPALIGATKKSPHPYMGAVKVRVVWNYIVVSKW